MQCIGVAYSQTTAFICLSAFGFAIRLLAMKSMSILKQLYHLSGSFKIITTIAAATSKTISEKFLSFSLCLCVIAIRKIETFGLKVSNIFCMPRNHTYVLHCPLEKKHELPFYHHCLFFFNAEKFSFFYSFIHVCQSVMTELYFSSMRLFRFVSFCFVKNEI